MNAPSWWIFAPLSAALLVAALGFQYLGDLPPCALCIWQRWPHLVAVLMGFIVFNSRAPGLLLLGGLSAFASALIGAYHLGVERGVFEGPATCTSGPIGDQTADQLLANIMAAPLVRCDEVAWAFGGVSMAGWNAIIATGLGLIWFAAWGQARRQHLPSA